MWVISSPTGGVSFKWHNSRSTVALEKTLQDQFEGILQTDAYQAYKSYRKSRSQTLTQASCMAHIRRGFYKAAEARERNAAQVLKLIGLLYELEESLRSSRAGPALREARRASEAAAILTRIYRFISRIKHHHLPKSLMGKAISYAQSNWTGLNAYLEDGRIELDNNLVENAIRPLKLGAKNYLFLGSERGGDLAAVAYTLIESCKRYDLPLRSYLEEVLRAIAQHGLSAAAELTPAKIAVARSKRKNLVA